MLDDFYRKRVVKVIDSEFKISSQPESEKNFEGKNLYL